MMNRICLPFGACFVFVCLLDICSLAAAPELDPYFGCKSVQCRASGFFRVEQLNGRWWLITPEGHPFFSLGVNVLSRNGTATKDGVRHYRETCDKLYATPERWVSAQKKRCAEWGINTVGCWSEWNLLRRQMPYTVRLGIGGQDWRQGVWCDVFAKKFRMFVRRKIEKVATPLKEDPRLLGYWLANEMKWGPDHRGGHLFDQFIKLPPESASRRRLQEFLVERYATPEALGKDFKITAATWKDVSVLDALPIGTGASGAVQTKLAWAGVVAERFFSVADEELKKVDPNHLNLGVRFISQLCPPAVLRVAGRHVDVMSINFYDVGNWVFVLRGFSPDYLPITAFLKEHYAVGGKPILISEWGYRAADAGLPNSWPPIYPTQPNQKARGACTEAYLRSALASPWIVGAHWFLWTDQPAEGRFDGENNNFGLVSEKDVPYREVTDVFQRMGAEMYRRALEK